MQSAKTWTWVCLATLAAWMVSGTVIADDGSDPPAFHGGGGVPILDRYHDQLPRQFDDEFTAADYYAIVVDTMAPFEGQLLLARDVGDTTYYFYWVVGNIEVWQAPDVPVDLDLFVDDNGRPAFAMGGLADGYLDITEGHILIRVYITSVGEFYWIEPIPDYPPSDPYAPLAPAR